MSDVLNITSDQKQVLLHAISEKIESFGVQSLLDIGAGQPLLALPLSQKVKKYLAVESSPNIAKQLRDANVSVIEGTFPKVNIQGTYDLVLASHSIPERVGLYKPFLEKAWSCVASGGLLLIITFKGVNDDLFLLTNRLRKNWTDEDALKYKEVLSVLSTFGAVEVEQITSHSVSEHTEDMADVLTFSIGGTEQEKAEYRSELTRILEEKYKNGTKYIFPHEHLVLSVQKK